MSKYARPVVSFWQELLLLILFNTLIAVFLNLIEKDIFLKKLIVAQSIGISIFSCIKLIAYFHHGKNNSLNSQLLGIPVGGILGIILGSFFTQAPLSRLLNFRNNELIFLLGAAIIFGTAISYFFHSRQRIHIQQIELHTQAQKRIQYEKDLMHSQLRLLQAQIEPHFLFNVLATVVSLIDKKPESAKKMVQQLSNFLRTSLLRTRNGNNTIKDEINLLKAYLCIQQVRMGTRLQFSIECEPNLLPLSLPPLLIQPLVENAIKHGLENTISGGQISIVFKRRDEQISISVNNSGPGFSSYSDHGIGLKNIRERLTALYGRAALMTLSENTSGGVKARITLPLNSRMNTNDLTHRFNS